jgi:hypothetical protein
MLRFCYVTVLAADTSSKFDPTVATLGRNVPYI